MKEYNDCRGFTLIELLVVISIITILMSILMPVFGKAKSVAMRLKCAHNLNQIDLTIRLYTSDYDDIYPCAADPLPTGYWLWMGRGWRSLVSPYLGGNIDVNNPSVLFCPEDKVAREKYESTSYSYSMSFYHSPEQIDSTTSTNDTYENPLPPMRQGVTRVRKPSRKIIFGEWLSNHEQIDNDQGWWCWDGTRSYLFADGSIYALKTKRISPARDDFPDANLTIHGIKGSDLNTSKRP